MHGPTRIRHPQDKQTMEAEEVDRHTAPQVEAEVTMEAEEADRHKALQVQAQTMAQWAIWDQWGMWPQENCSTTKWP